MAASRSSRTALMVMLRRYFREASRSRAGVQSGTGLRKEEGFRLREGMAGGPVSGALDRRDFLKGALILGAGTLIPGCRKDGAANQGGSAGGHASSAEPPKVAIVGAGIAGLSAAHHLAKAGIRADLFEASGRAGGRILTLRDVVADGMFTEAGGEFIDSGHKDLLDLAAELGLGVADMRSDGYKGLSPVAWRFGGKIRSEAEVLAEVKAATGVLQRDIDALPDEIVMGIGGLAAKLDRMSLEDYLKDRGITGWFGDLLKAAYVTEFGLDVEEQSSLNLLTMVSLDTSGDEFAVYGDSDERYRIEGGNQGITDGLAGRYSDRLRSGHRLEALSGGSGGYVLSLQGPSGAVEHKADTVILALPFTMLRKVDIKVELPEGKRRAIADLGMGTNAKLFVGYSSRPWRKNGYLGYYYTDGALQSGWDHTQTQAGEAGGLTLFQGGRAGLDLGKGSPATQAEAFATELEALFPGTRAARNGRLGAFNWPGFPLTEGSYSCYKPGQWTGFGGQEGTSVGDLHFAGEQCSSEFQGYMNGGAESGRLAAEAVIAKWKGKANAA